MLDNADPLTGWDMESIQAAYPRPATNDLYGKLYHYLLSLFVQFHRLLASRPVSVKLFQVDARSLPAHLESIKFDRVEVCLSFFKRLLQAIPLWHFIRI